MEKKQYKDMIKLLDEFEVKKKINELRSKLNRALEANIDTCDIVNISQELDQYIAFEQRKLVNKLDGRFTVCDRGHFPLIFLNTN